VDTLDIDVRDVEPEQLEGFEAVCHLAAVSNDATGDINPDCTYDVNWHASARLARVAKAAGVRRFVFSSSCSVYGAGAEGTVDESTSCTPVTAYGESKLLAEFQIATLADADFTPTFLRNATAYGVAYRHRGDLVLNDLVGLAVTTGQVTLTSDGSAWRPLVHVEDIGRAFVAVLDAPADRMHNRVFNVGRDEDNYTVRHVAEIVVRAVPGSVMRFAGGAGPDMRSYRVSFRAIARDLKEFKPQRTVQAAVQDLIEAYTGEGVTAEEFAGSRFRRILRVREMQDGGSLTHDLRWAALPAAFEPPVGVQEVI
jgi:nucleoside-diphosphate-sugar epimerase